MSLLFHKPIMQIILIGKVEESLVFFTYDSLQEKMFRRYNQGLKMVNTCTPMADSCQCMAKTTQYCKVNSLQLK